MSSSTHGKVRPGIVLEGKYNLTRELGAGGMGQVFLARHETLEREVAIKVLHQNLAGDESVRRRFETEAKAIARLRHPNCVMLYEFGFSEEIEALFAVFEYVQGDSLEIFVGETLPVGDVLEMGKQVAQGIAHAHSQNIIHRDLKPENIMVVPLEEGGVEVKVLDFGIARIAEDDEKRTRLTQMGQMFGTPPYMSPEQIRAKLNVTFATDIYSIGILMYEMLEGELPFLGETPIETVMMHLHDEVPPMKREGIPDELREIVMRCLLKDADERFASCKKLYLALEMVDWDSDEPSAFTPSADEDIALSKENVEETYQGEPQRCDEESLDADDSTSSEKEIREREDIASAPTLLSTPAIEEAGKAETTQPDRDKKAPTTQDMEDSGRIQTIAPMGQRKNKIVAAVVAVVFLFALSGAVIVISTGGDDEGEDQRGSAIAEESSDEVEEPEEDIEELPEVESEFEEEIAAHDDESEEEVEVQDELDEELAVEEDDQDRSPAVSQPSPSTTTRSAPSPPQAVEEEEEEEVREEEVAQEEATPDAIRLERRRRGRDEEESETEDRDEPEGIRLPGRN